MAGSKRPSFQFYPADWQANSNLRRCTHEEKGIWMDVMCVMHDQEEYGVIRWPLKEIAQAVGTSTAKLKQLASKGILKGADTGPVQDLVFTPTGSGRKKLDPVVLIEGQQGPLWYSSRMVLDEYKRTVRGEYGNAPKDAPKAPIGAGIGDTPKAAPNPAPDSAPSRARASSPSPSSIPSRTLSGDSTVESAGEVGSPPPDALAVRATELTVLLHQRGASLQASDPRVRKWAESGVSDAQALQALELAQSRRAEKGSAQAINAGLLDAILSDIRGSPPASAAQQKGRAPTVHDQRRAAGIAIFGNVGQQEKGDERVIDITRTAGRAALE